MERELLGMPVRQNHKTGYLNLNDLEKIGDNIREGNGLKRKNGLANYFQTSATKEFMQAVSIEEGIPVKELRIVKRGRGGGQYAHPLIFLDVAMWYDQTLKVKILKWFYDNLLMFRDNSGESFKAMNKALDENYVMEPLTYSQVSNYIASICKVGHGAKRWNLATEEQLELRDKIQTNVVLLADLGLDITTLIQKSAQKAKQLGEITE
jgi:hypothetical protein